MPECNCRTIAFVRESYLPGGKPFWSQVLNASSRGPWYPGALLGIDGIVAEIRLDDSDDKRVLLGTLWPDRLMREAIGNVERTADGLPAVQWNKASGVLRLQSYGIDNPVFNVVNLDKHPQWIIEIGVLPATCDHVDGPPADG